MQYIIDISIIKNEEDMKIKLYKTNIVKNTAMLYMMNIAKMIFPLLTLPYLTRVLSVNCYGFVSYVKAVMQYMQLIVDFGFTLSGTKDIVLSKNQQNFGYEVGNILISKLILSCLAGIVLCAVIYLIPILRDNILYTLLSFLVVFLTNFLFDYLFRGLEKMEIITIRFVIMKGLATILTFAVIHGDSDILWIPILDIIGSLIAILLVGIEVFKLKIKLKCSGFKVIAEKIKSSAIYFFSNMATTAFMALNTLVIGFFLSPSEVAYWSLCLQMITAVQAMYTPLTDGIYPHMVKSKDLGLIKKAVKLYMPIISIGCLFTFAVSKYALLIFGGQLYVAAANILRALIPVLFFGFLSMLLGWPTLGAIDKQREVTITTIFTAIVQVLGLGVLLLTRQFSLLNIALLRGVTEFLLFGLRFRYVLKFKSAFQ
jgi:PST family polysaccharide transporter